MKRSRNHQRWTVEELCALHVMLEDGLFYKDIAHRLGRTPHAVRGKIAVSGLHKPKHNPRLVADLLLPHCVRYLARKYDMSEAAVYNMRSKLRKEGHPVGSTLLQSQRRRNVRKETQELR